MEQKEQGTQVLPTIIWDEKFERLQINFNTLMKGIARAFTDSLVMQEEILEDLLVKVDSRIGKQPDPKESKRVRNRVLITHSIMQRTLDISYVTSAKINATPIKGSIFIGRDYATDLLYLIDGKHVQGKFVPTNKVGWIENGIPESDIEELVEKLNGFDAEQLEYGIKKCNSFWTKNKEFPKKFLT